NEDAVQNLDETSSVWHDGPSSCDGRSDSRRQMPSPEESDSSRPPHDEGPSCHIQTHDESFHTHAKQNLDETKSAPGESGDVSPRMNGAKTVNPDTTFHRSGDSHRRAHLESHANKNLDETSPQ